MATKKDAGGRYVVLRDFGGNLAGDIIDLEPAAAAELVRDGMVAPEGGDS
jgi:hypothetical protein